MLLLRTFGVSFSHLKNKIPTTRWIRHICLKGPWPCQWMHFHCSTTSVYITTGGKEHTHFRQQKDKQVKHFGYLLCPDVSCIVTSRATNATRHIKSIQTCRAAWRDPVLSIGNTLHRNREERGRVVCNPYGLHSQWLQCPLADLSPQTRSCRPILNSELQAVIIQSLCTYLCTMLHIASASRYGLQAPVVVVVVGCLLLH